MSMMGEPNSPPIKVGVAVADIAGGMFAAFGIMIALFYRQKTGKGQKIDNSLLDNQIAWLTYRASSFFITGENPKPLGSGHPAIVPYQAFKAKDTYFNLAVGNDQLWEKFCKAAGLESIIYDPKFAINSKRVENREELLKILEDVISTKEAEEWLEKLPGPYTLILKTKTKNCVAKSVNPGNGTLGVRLPKHWFTVVARKLGKPIVTTSSNKVGGDFMTNIDNLDSDIKAKMDFCVYEGEKMGRPSTIVHLEGEETKVRKR